MNKYVPSASLTPRCRFVARAKMHEIEMLGLLDHDVLSSIELPFLPDMTDPAATPNPSIQLGRINQADADRFDNEVFAARPESRQQMANRNSVTSSVGSYRSYGSSDLKRSLSTRTADTVRSIPPIQESPHHLVADLPFDPPSADADHRLSKTSFQLSSSPSQSSVRSAHSALSALSTATSSTANESTRSRASAQRAAAKTSRFTPSWLWNTFTRSGPSQPQTSAVSASGVTSPLAPSPLTSRPPLPTQFASTSAVPTQIPPHRRRSPKPMTIGSPSKSRLGTIRNLEEDSIPSHRGSLTRQSPVNTPPRDETTFGKRRSMTITSYISPLSSSSPVVRTNPSRPLDAVPSSQASLARRWQHLFPQPLSKHDIKWKSLVTPACLPLSVEYLPSTSELESSYDMSLYDFVVDPPEMKSFFVRPPTVSIGSSPEAVRRAWALVVMRGMVAVRLAQGFQFVLRSPSSMTPDMENMGTLRRMVPYAAGGEAGTTPTGSAEVLKSANEPLYLSMSNEIHRIAYSGDSIQVRRYVRRMPRARPFDYQCLIWPKLGVGYTELRTSFVSHGLENYGWNRCGPFFLIS